LDFECGTSISLASPPWTSHLGPRWTLGVAVPSVASESWTSYLGIHLTKVRAAQDKGDDGRRETRVTAGYIRFRMHGFSRGLLANVQYLLGGFNYKIYEHHWILILWLRFVAYTLSCRLHMLSIISPVLSPRVPFFPQLGASRNTKMVPIFSTPPSLCGVTDFFSYFINNIL
jgi:hypothetical protein